MATFGLILLFLIAGSVVIFIAYSGGLGAARQAYLTRGGTFFKIAIPLIYVGLGIAVPAVVIAGGEKKKGTEGALANQSAEGNIAEGKTLFQNTCAACHSLGAVNARGVHGPNLDELGEMTEQRVLEAIKTGAGGRGVMPANLLQGKAAEDVAAYVAQVAGR